MKLPEIFKQDIQSNNIQLIPLLIIERDGFNYSQYLDDATRKSLFISTHDITIQKGNLGEGIAPFGTTSFVPNGMHFSPLLLDSPVITEKIDVENRQYTISKCTFKISNNPYNGERFSDMFIEGLIGTKVNFAYKSINSLIPIFSVQTGGGNTWADAYDDYIGVSPTFYFGEIRDIKHDNETVTITAEDLSSNLLHQDVPKNSLSSNSSIQEHYRGVKIPMVYGYMPKSPVVMGASRKIYADSRPIKNWFRNDVNRPGRYGYPFGESDYGALFISVDDNLCNISNNIDFPLTETQKITDWGGYDVNPEQVNYDDIDETYGVSVAKLTKNPLLSKSMLQVLSVYKPSKISLEERHNDVTWDPDNISGTSLGDSDVDWLEDFLLEDEFEEMTDGDYSPNNTLASSDTPEYIRTEAMINGSTQQMHRNHYKHSLFRFVIDVEPPIEFINRGGIGQGYQQYGHWISFGHWVMPNQGSGDGEESHNIYTCARDNDADDSSDKIRKRRIAFWTSPDEDGNIEVDEYNEVDYLKVSPYQVSNPLLDHWGRQIQLGDIIRFSNFHDDATFGDTNPEQINWSNHGGGKSPLEFYDLGYINETTNNAYDKSYSNPYAKFTNGSEYGWYEIQLGAYGWLGSLSFSIDGVDQTSQYTNPPDLCPNFDYTGNIKGWLPEVNCMSVCDIKTNFHDMYGSILGRKDANENLITHPADIIADIFVNELGYSSNKIDQDSLDDTKELYSNHNSKFSFTQSEQINSKDLIEDIARSTLIFPRIGFDGLLKFPQIKKLYDQTDLDNSILIEDLDVISYSYNLTKRQDLITATHIKYDYDHQNDNYFGDKDTKSYAGYNITDITEVTDEEALYHGIEDKSEHIKEFESKYLRSNDYTDSDVDSSDFIQSIRRFQNMNTHHYRNRHLVIKCKLPIRYLNIEVGDYVRFNKLIDGIKAYGIDYTKVGTINSQSIYPLFLCTSMKKSIEYIELECLQLHHLFFTYDSVNSTPSEIWDDIGEEQIQSIYHDGNLSVEEEPEEGEEGEEGLETGLAWMEDQEINIVDVMFLNSSSQFLYNYSTFNLIPGGTDHPYYLSEFYGSYLIIQRLNQEYNFGDPDTGIHALFSPEHFKVEFSIAGGFVPIQSWNDLLPGDFTTTTAGNQNYTILEIVHFKTYSLNFGNYSFYYTYKLKNTQTIIGEPIIIDWELTVTEGDDNFDNGIIWATPYTNTGSIQTTTLHEFVMRNNSAYSIAYYSPHPMGVPTTQLEESYYLTYGDVNQDGIVDVLDLVSLANLILEAGDYSESADTNQDEVINILDVVLLMNQILGNE